MSVIENDDEFEVTMETTDGKEEAPTTKRSVNTKHNNNNNRKTKGRGFKSAAADDDRYAGKAGQFEALDEPEENTNAQKSIEGWIVFVSGIHPEAQEDDIHDLFADCGDIKQLNLNLDRRTGYVKGYALIEYEKFHEAQKAIDELDNTNLHEQPIQVDWAFKRPNNAAASNRGNRGRRVTRRR